jgi:hypothetical protein
MNKEPDLYVSNLTQTGDNEARLELVLKQIQGSSIMLRIWASIHGELC